MEVFSHAFLSKRVIVFSLIRESAGSRVRAALEAVDGAVGALEPGSPVLAREVKDRWKRR